MSGINETYYNRYEDICDEIGRCVVSIGMLKAFGDVQKSGFDTDDSRIIVLNHICELTKRDLVLTTWKLFYDKNPKANSVKSLNNYLHTLGYGSKVKMKLSDEVNSLEEPLCNIRKEYLAHNDFDTETHNVEMKLVIKAFYEIVDLSKCLFDKEVDERVEPLSDAAIKLAEYKSYCGTMKMLGIVT